VPAAGQQPDFVAIPNRSDGTKDGAALGIGARHEKVDGAGAEIEASRTTYIAIMTATRQNQTVSMTEPQIAGESGSSGRSGPVSISR